MSLYCLGFDPGVSHFAWVLVKDAGGSHAPRLHSYASRTLRPKPDEERTVLDNAYDYIKQVIDDAIAETAPDDLIIGCETFEHRPYIQRRVNSAPDMGAVAATIAVVAKTWGIPLYDVKARDHKNTLPLSVYPKDLRNNHQRDAYSVATFSIGLYRYNARVGNGAR